MRGSRRSSPTRASRRALVTTLVALAAAVSGCGDDSGGGSGSDSGLPVDESTPLATDDRGAWVARDGKLVLIDNELKEVGAADLRERPTAWAVGPDGMLWTARDGTVQRVDPGTRRPVGEELDLGVPDEDPYTERIVAGGDVVWVETSEYVTRVDVETGRVLGPHLRAMGFVSELVADEDAAYIVSSPSAAEGSDTGISRIDAATGEVTNVEPEPERGIFFAQFAVGAGQLWVTQSRTAAERGRTYTQDTGTVTRYDAKTLEQNGRPTKISPDPQSIAVTPDTAWIVDASGDIAVVDTRTGARRPSPRPLAEPAVAAAGERVVYLWERGGRLHAFDQQSAEPAGAVRDVQPVPGQIAVTGDALWLLDEPTQDPESDDEPPWTLTRVGR